MDTVIQVIESQYFRLGLRAVILIVFIIAAYNLVMYFKNYSRVAANIQSAYLKMQDAEKQRMERERLERALKGMGANQGVLEKFDELLNYSGLKDIKITHRTKNGTIITHRVTTEIALLMLVAIVCISVTISVSVTKSPLFGTILAVLEVVMAFTLLRVACYYRNKRIEDQMIKFMNLLENFSSSRDDIIDVLSGAAGYLDKPLGPILYDAVAQANASGDVGIALQMLQDRVSSKYFKQLVHNLELASHFEANYSTIVQDIRGIYTEYSKVDKEKSQMKVSGALQTMAIIIIGFFCIWMLGDVTGEENIIYALRMGGFIGNLLLVYLIVATILAFYIGVIKVLLD